MPEPVTALYFFLARTTGWMSHVSAFSFVPFAAHTTAGIGVCLRLPFASQRAAKRMPL